MNTLLSTFRESPEFELLLKLTHPHPDINQSAIIALLLDSRFDNAQFLQMLEWHRITPQVYQQLKPIKDDLPDAFFSQLKLMNTRCRMTALNMSSWLANITRQLDAQNISFVSLKGIALSQLLYGDGSYREVRDIDILVAVEDVDATESVLLGLGFVRIMPDAGATEKQLRYFNRHKKDREYYHPNDGTLLELHWRLIEVDHPFNPLLPELLADGSTMTVHGETITAIGEPYLWLYQCLHGSLSGWYRMRWICDIALLLSVHQPDWDELLQCADRYQCKNSLLEAVGLACALYELPVPKPVQPLLHHNRRVQKNIERAASRLFHRQTICGDLITYARLISFCAPSSSLLKYLLGRVLISTEDFELLRLPNQLFFAYYLLRPFLFLFRHLIQGK